MRPRTISLLVAATAVALVGCGDGEADDDRLDPDGESIIDQDIDDETLITDPGGITNNIDGNDGDVEDEGNLLED